MNTLDANNFTAYKISTCCNQTRWGFIYGLSKSDIDKLPFGTQQDTTGAYTWGYGINNGKKV